MSVIMSIRYTVGREQKNMLLINPTSFSVQEVKEVNTLSDFLGLNMPKLFSLICTDDNGRHLLFCSYDEEYLLQCFSTLSIKKTLLEKHPKQNNILIL